MIARTIIMLFLLSVPLWFSGCASTVVQDGIEYKALSKSETEHLILISRAALKNNLNKKLISRAEYRFAIKNQPQVRIQYRGDKFGLATISWRTGRRVLEFRYEDDLTSEIIQKCSFSTYNIPAHERRTQPDKSIPGR